MRYFTQYCPNEDWFEEQEISEREPGTRFLIIRRAVFSENRRAARGAFAAARKRLIYEKNYRP
jgi:hypothetical protein